MGRQDDLRKTYVCNQVQDSGKKQLNKHNINNITKVTGSCLRSESNVYLCLRSVLQCCTLELYKSETYLLISIT